MLMGEHARQVDALLERGEPRAFGRYVLYAPIARGGMATIHIARLVGDDGFSRIVAAKRLHPQFTEDPDFVEMFRDEAEIASKVRHPNVVPVLDIVLDGEDVVLVQEYVHGVPLDRLFRAACARNEPIPPRIAVGIVAGVLAGLHAAHETADDRSHPLGIVHRDVSPQNIMLSVDGIPRLLDFGIAKAQTSAHVTRAGLLMGKLAYMAPEQMRSEVVTRAADIYACGVVLWELLALRRLHMDRAQAQILAAVLGGPAPTLTEALEPMREGILHGRWEILSRIAPIAARAMSMAPEERYPTAAEMLRDLVRVAPVASALELADWVKGRGGEYLERRQQVLAHIEESWRSVSKIALAPTSGPQSGVQRVRDGSGVVTAATLASSLYPPTPASAMYVPMQQPPEPRASLAEVPLASNPPPAVDGPRSTRMMPWMVAGMSVLVSTILVGVLVAKRPTVEIPPAPPSREPVAAVVAPAPSAPPIASAEPWVPATSFLAPAMGAKSAAAAVHVYAAPPARKAAAEPVALLPVRASPTPAATPAPPPKADCDPPFYFEGTKKVFKPSCI
jgi:eukaryotic-like serine/threonine-protein kinase